MCVRFKEMDLLDFLCVLEGIVFFLDDFWDDVEVV